MGASADAGPWPLRPSSAGLRLPHKLWLLPFAESGHFWRATLPSALSYAAAGFA